MYANKINDLKDAWLFKPMTEIYQSIYAIPNFFTLIYDRDMDIRCHLLKNEYKGQILWST
jgi:hypothetical protein